MESTPNWTRFAEGRWLERSRTRVRGNLEQQKLLALALTMPHRVSRPAADDVCRRGIRACRGDRALDAGWVQPTPN